MDDLDLWNALSTLNYERRADTPGKTWWNCDIYHPAIARALKIERSQEGGVFALAPFRLWHDGEKHVILAAYPTPRILGPVDSDWLDVEAVIAWNPVTDTAEILGDVQPQTVGHFPDPELGTLYTSPREFFQQWAIERAGFFVRWCQSRRGEWAHGATENDLVPGKLAVGDLTKMRWDDLPASVEARGINPTELNRMILRQANLPRAHGTAERMVA